MKKILWMVLIFTLSVMSTAFAYSDESNADAQNVLSSIKEIRYNVEVGVNLKDYSSLTHKATIDYMKYKEKYPVNDRDSNLDIKIKTLLADYNDARTIWQNALFNDISILHTADIKILKSIHPNLTVKNIPNNADDYYYEDILHALWSIAANDEKSITQQQ